MIQCLVIWGRTKSNVLERATSSPKLPNPWTLGHPDHPSVCLCWSCYLLICLHQSTSCLLAISFKVIPSLLVSPNCWGSLCWCHCFPEVVALPPGVCQGYFSLSCFMFLLLPHLLNHQIPTLHALSKVIALSLTLPRSSLPPRHTPFLLQMSSHYLVNGTNAAPLEWHSSPSPCTKHAV